MDPTALQPKHKILYSLMIVLLCVLVVEGTTHLLTRGPRWVNPYYVEMSKDFARLDELISDKQNTHHLKYYDEFLYATAPISLTHISYTDYYSSRWTPDSVPLSEAENIVWAFGGSTMENQETTDDLTIANTWAKVFNRTLGPTHVKNFGTGSFFSSYELIKFQKLLREVPESELPSMVIFYDGYNDANNSFLFGAGNMQKDLSLKLQALVEHRYLVLWSYASSNMVSKLSGFWEHTGARLVEVTLFPPLAPQGQHDNLEAAVRVYVSNVKMIETICEAFDIDCFFILQPLIVTKSPPTPLEQEVLDNLKIGPEGIVFAQDFYDEVRRKLVDNGRFIDASYILNGRTKSDFYDLGHTGAETSPVIGERTGSMILARVKTKDQQNLVSSLQGRTSCVEHHQ
jgi:hypothetical protein